MCHAIQTRNVSTIHYIKSYIYWIIEFGDEKCSGVVDGGGGGCELRGEDLTGPAPPLACHSLTSLSNR